MDRTVSLSHVGQTRGRICRVLTYAHAVFRLKAMTVQHEGTMSLPRFDLSLVVRGQGS
jgi:hypothetical protein